MFWMTVVVRLVFFNQGCCQPHFCVIIQVSSVHALCPSRSAVFFFICKYVVEPALRVAFTAINFQKLVCATAVWKYFIGKNKIVANWNCEVVKKRGHVPKHASVAPANLFTSLYEAFWDSVWRQRAGAKKTNWMKSMQTHKKFPMNVTVVRPSSRPQIWPTHVKSHVLPKRTQKKHLPTSQLHPN